MINADLYALIWQLGDGQFHSQTQLSLSLGQPESVVEKLIAQVSTVGLDIICRQGNQYCIPDGIEFFSYEEISRYLETSLSVQLKCVEVFMGLASTNHYLVEKVKSQQVDKAVCLAEYQSAGKGRNESVWISPFGRSISLSLLWYFPSSAALTGLTLAVGVAIVHALQSYGIESVGLKWPNDIYHAQRKLAGILVEMVTDSTGGCYAVIGVGLNLALPRNAQALMNQPWTDIETITHEKPQKNVLVALLLNELGRMLVNFEGEGFAAYCDEWRRYDLLVDKCITLHTLQGDIDGVAVGIDAQGSLLVRSVNEVHRISSGSVSVRW